MSSMDDISKYLSKKVYQYELQTALYMLEPWEKILFSKYNREQYRNVTYIINRLPCIMSSKSLNCNNISLYTICICYIHGNITN